MVSIEGGKIMSNLSVEQIIDLLYYLGTDKVIYKPGNK